MLTRAVPDKKSLDQVPLTLSMTLTVQQWREVREQMESKWPACDVRMAIYDAVQKIETALSFYDRKDQS